MSSSVSSTTSTPRSNIKSIIAIDSLVLYLIAIALAIVLAFTMSQLLQGRPGDVRVNPKGLDFAQYDALTTSLNELNLVNVALGSQKDNATAAASLTSTSSFFTAPLATLLTDVTKHEWVADAQIKRHWRDGITITVLPRDPVAKFGSERFIDADGVVFSPASTNVDRSDLALLQGRTDQAKLIMQQMQQINTWFAPLNLQVDDLILTPRMTWLIRFNNGLRVVVDNDHTNQKLMNLSQMLQTQLATRQSDIASVDLRYQNGFAITWQPKSSRPMNEDGRDANTFSDTSGL